VIHPLRDVEIAPRPLDDLAPLLLAPGRIDKGIGEMTMRAGETIMMTDETATTIDEMTPRIVGAVIRADKKWIAAESRRGWCYGCM
jgi:hypothetical protein